MKKIKEFREERGLSLREVSEKTGVNFGSLSACENHKKRLTYASASQLAKLYKTSPEYLHAVQNFHYIYHQYNQICTNFERYSEDEIKSAFGDFQKYLSESRPAKTNINRMNHDSEFDIFFLRKIEFLKFVLSVAEYKILEGYTEDFPRLDKIYDLLGFLGSTNEQYVCENFDKIDIYFDSLICEFGVPEIDYNSHYRFADKYSEGLEHLSDINQVAHTIAQLKKLNWEYFVEAGKKIENGEFDWSEIE